MIDHILKSYDDELARLGDELLRMGELALRQLQAAIVAMEQRDEVAARRVIDADDHIDRLEREISHDVVRLLALRAPIAGDLRQVFATLRVATDIERIGDHAVNLARRSIALPGDAAVQLGAALRPLAELATSNVRAALLAWRERDTGRARQVWEADTRLDEAWAACFRSLLACMMDEPRTITSCTQLLLMAKDIERVGDHASNIAENVGFAVGGATIAIGGGLRDPAGAPA
ncbi:MAG: phosphate transport system regulatory protein PhoU [Xanthomonadales bacterium]|nr:phosphate transport system regulatory protein PhoU [Xanthomonadales bacterium]MDL1868082.1 phosphate signaling complex protein PhoU [Gammaproteobacteria bacterium PRO6]